MQEFGDRCRRHPGDIDAGDFNDAGDEFLVATTDMMAEDDAHPGQFFYFEADAEQVVEPRRLQVLATGLARDEGDTGIERQLRRQRSKNFR